MFGFSRLTVFLTGFDRIVCFYSSSMAPKKRKASVAPSVSSGDDQEIDDKSAAEEQHPQNVISPPYLIKRDPRNFCIPKGPDFQADVPNVTEVLDKESYRALTKDSKWLGTSVLTPDDDNTDIGRGRPTANCKCKAPMSEECVKLHVSEKTSQLKLQLGTVFEAWGFDTMGEVVANSWNAKEERIFRGIVSSKKGLLLPGTTLKLSKSYMEIISYYFNVLILRQIRAQAKHGDTVNSDDDTYADKRRKRGVSLGVSASSKYLKCPEPSIKSQ